MNLLVLLGSLRGDSLSSRLAHAVTSGLGAHVRVVISAAPRQLPHYDADLDRSEVLPASVREFRDEVRSADALLVVTPEYNGSLPGALKNAIDWASRPRGDAPLDGLPTSVVSVSPSPRGAQWAREDAVKVLTVAGAAVQDSSAGVGVAHEVLAEEGHAELAALRTLVGGLTQAVPAA